MSAAPSGPAPGPVDPTARAWPLVGRSPELEALAALHADKAVAGALVTGRSGVGKTRIAVAFGAEQPERRTVLRVQGSSALRSIPFGALARLVALGSWTADRAPEAVARAADDLAGHGDRRSLVVIVDDAHLLDPLSADTVEELARRGAAFLLLTVRTDDPAGDAAADRWTGAGLARVEVGALTFEQVADLLVAALDGPVAGAATERLWAASQGNPLYLRELVIAGLSSGSLVREDGLWRLDRPLAPTPRIVDVVGARLRGVSDEERAALELSAVGGPLPVELARRLVDDAAAERLVRAGLVEHLTVGGHRLRRLAHPIYGEVIRAGLPPTAARAIRKRLADAASELRETTAVDVLQVATWRLDSGEPASPRLLLAAARRARAVAELELAERLARAAWAAGGGVLAGLALGEIVTTAGNYDAAEDLYHDLQAELLEAGRDALDAESASILALVALSRAFNAYWGMGDVRVAAAALDGALAVLEGGVRRGVPGASAWVDELRAERASHLAFGAAVREALAVSDGLLDGPELPPRVLARASFAGSVASFVAGAAEDAAGLADRGLAATDQLPTYGRQTFQTFLGVAKANALLYAGHLAEAEQVARDVMGEALTSRDITREGLGGWALGRVLLARGRPVEAARWFREAIQHDRDFLPAGRVRWSWIGLAHALALVGDAAGARATLDEMATLHTGDDRFLDAEADRSRAWTLVAEHQVPAAVELLDVVAEHAGRDGQHALEAWLRHDVLRLAPSRAAAERLLAAVPKLQGPAAAAMAVHAEAVRAPDAAPLLAAGDAWERLGADVVAAELAVLAADRARRADSASAAERAGAVAAARIARCEGASTPGSRAAAAPVVLTARQREIALLAAQGLGNAEIGARLDLSVRTVANHLQRVYEQTGIRRRQDLAEALGQA